MKSYCVYGFRPRCVIFKNKIALILLHLIIIYGWLFYNYNLITHFLIFFVVVIYQCPTITFIYYKVYSIIQQTDEISPQNFILFGKTFRDDIK